MGCSRRDLFRPFGVLCNYVHRFLRQTYRVRFRPALVSFTVFRLIYTTGPKRQPRNKLSRVQPERLSSTRPYVKTHRGPQKIVNKTYWFDRSFHFGLQLKSFFRIVRVPVHSAERTRTSVVVKRPNGRYLFFGQFAFHVSFRISLRHSHGR